MVSLRRAVAAGAAATIAGGLVTGVVVYHAVHPSGQAGEIYDVLRQADSISQKYFVGEDYDTDDLINGTLTGYAQGLGDRWTSYMTPEYYQSYQESSADSTVGIGVTVSYLENDDGTHYLYVNTVATDSPAQKAGIGCYDKITAINGKCIDDFGSYDKAVAAVRGKAGGVVQLGIHQYATNQDVTLSVTREEYEQIHVTSRMLDNQIGYIRIEKFADNTDEQFDAAVKEMQKQGAASLLFDLRNNPGGQLTALVNCLDTLMQMRWICRWRCSSMRIRTARRSFSRLHCRNTERQRLSEKRPSARDTPSRALSCPTAAASTSRRTATTRRRASA